MKKLFYLVLLISTIAAAQDSTAVKQDVIKQDQVRIYKMREFWIARKDSIVKAHTQQLDECERAITECNGALWYISQKLKPVPGVTAYKEE
jgi:hypothetical protein